MNSIEEKRQKLNERAKEIQKERTKVDVVEVDKEVVRYRTATRKVSKMVPREVRRGLFRRRRTIWE